MLQHSLFSQDLISTNVFDDESLPMDISFNAMCPTTDGGYALVGSSGSPSNGVILKISSNDEIEWWYQYGNDDNLDNMEFNDVIQIEDHLYIVGDGYDDNGNRLPYIQKTDLNQHPDSASFVGSFSFEDDARMYGARGLAIQRTYRDDRFVIGGFGFPNGDQGEQQGYFYQMLIEPNDIINVAGADPTFKPQTKAIWEIGRSLSDKFFYLFADSNRPQEEQCAGLDGQDVLVARLNDVLEFSWADEFIEIGGGTRDEYIDAITTADGGFALLGRTDCPNSSGVSGPDNVCFDTDSFRPFWIYKGTRDGGFEWSKSLTGGGAIAPFGLFNYCLQDEYMIGYNDLSVETGPGLELYRTGESLDQIQASRVDFENANDQAYQIIRSATGEVVVGSTTCVLNDGCTRDLTAIRLTREQDCYSICDLSASFIGGNTNYIIDIDAGDAAPPLISTIPCIIDAYGGNVPSRLLYNLRLYENTSFKPIVFEPIDDVGPNFRAFIFRCEGINGNISQICEGRYEDLEDTALPTGFYYILMTETEERDYVISVPVPGAACNLREAPVLTCGSETINGPVPRPDAPVNLMSVEAENFTGYDMCYGGIRTYDGAEEAFSLEITEPSLVNITFTTSAGKGGLFLFIKNCGEQCINYLEAPDGGGEVVLSDLMFTAEKYYLIVDQEADAPIGDFSISVDCGEDQANNELGLALGLASSEDVDCQLIEGSEDEIRLNFLNSENLSLSNGNVFSFNTVDLSFSNNPDLAKSYSNGDDLVFQIREAIGNPPCSFQPNDSLQLFLQQKNDGFISNYFPLKVDFYDANNPNQKVAGTFQGRTSRVIRSFSKATPLPALKLFTSYAFGPGEKSRKIKIQPGNNISVTGTESWVTLLVDGVSGYQLKVQENDSYSPRMTEMIISHRQFPDLTQSIEIIQYGKCAPPQVPDGPQIIQVCQDQEVDLQLSEVGPGPESIYAYKWSNGDTTSSITVSPSIDTQYEVTVTQNPTSACTASSRLTYQIDVIESPPIPMANQMTYTFCEGSDPDELSATTTDNNRFRLNWYNEQDELLQSNALNYQPEIEGTYFVRAEDIDTGCKSEPLEFEVIKEPVIVFSITPENQAISSCLGEEIQFGPVHSEEEALEYEWSKAGLVLSRNASYLYTVQEVGNTEITLRVNRPNGPCSELRTFNIATVAKPDLVATSPVNLTICAGETASLEVEEVGNQYEVNWYNEEGQEVANNRLAYEANKEGMYYVQAEPLEAQFQECISEPLYFSIIESPSLNLQLFPDAPNGIQGCVGEIILLEAMVDVEDASYQWKVGGFVLNDEKTLNYQLQMEEIFDIDVTVTSIDSACMEEQSVKITAINQPTIQESSSSNCMDDRETYSLTVATTYADTIEADFPQVIITKIGDGEYHLENIPASETVDITVTHFFEGVTCSEVLRLFPNLTCGCAMVEIPSPEPNDDMSFTICEGQDFPSFNVTVDQEQYIINWYSEVGPLPIGNGPTFNPDKAGIYFAEAQSRENSCASEPLQFQITEVPSLDLQTNLDDVEQLKCIGDEFSVGVHVQPNDQFRYAWTENGDSLSASQIFRYSVINAGASSLELIVSDEAGNCLDYLEIPIQALEQSTISVDSWDCSDDQDAYSIIVETTFTDTLLFDQPEVTYQYLGDGNYEIDNLSKDKSYTIEASRFFNDSLLCQRLQPIQAIGTCPIPVQATAVEQIADIIKVYPNPISDQVIVEFSEPPRDVVEFQLMDVLGRRVFNRFSSFPIQEKRTQLDLTSVSAGTYWLQIRTRENQYYFRVVKA